MFTGIVKEVGKVDSLEKAGNIYRLAVEASAISKAINIGDSVSVNGACLTLVKKSGNIIYFDIMEETVSKTNLKLLKSRDAVNLEGSLRAGDPLGGHYVLGHIDCVGKITDVKRSSKGISLEVGVPKEFGSLIVPKGSIALDGVSLTVGNIDNGKFKVYIIPHTAYATTLGSRKVGGGLNVEFDIIGKYVANLRKEENQNRITEEFLRNKGF